MSSRRPVSCLFALGLLATAMLVVGCEAKRPLGKVAGRVTFRGKPLNQGTVIFSNEPEGVGFQTPIQADGTYLGEVKDGYGLPPGSYKVAIRPPQPRPSMDVMAPPVSANAEQADIPAQYRDWETSGFTANVVVGENPPFDFDMK